MGGDGGEEPEAARKRIRGDVRAGRRAGGWGGEAGPSQDPGTS